MYGRGNVAGEKAAPPHQCSPQVSGSSAVMRIMKIETPVTTKGHLQVLAQAGVLSL